MNKDEQLIWEAYNDLDIGEELIRFLQLHSQNAPRCLWDLAHLLVKYKSVFPDVQTLESGLDDHFGYDLLA